MGTLANEVISSATKQIADIMMVKCEEVIYTSGSSEANNLAIKGIAFKYQNRGKHIITSHFEHSSIYGALNYLMTLGFDVDFVKSDENGKVDLEDLKKLIRKDTVLVTIASVNSEIGILQDINEIGKIIKEYPFCHFHSDMTQSVGKVKVDNSMVDLISFSAHKFYGLKGIGCLIKKEKTELIPIIHGGKSTTAYRSGTPALPLIVSLAKALRLINSNNDYNHILELNNYLKDNLKGYKKVYINSNDKCIPHILNISVVGVRPETFLHALEAYDIYISTQSACAVGDYSKAVLALTNDMDRAKSSLRISLSYLTTKEEIETFLDAFKKCYQELVNENN